MAGSATLTGANVVTPEGVLQHGWVQVRDGLIAGTGAGAAPESGTDLDGCWLVPGFVDLHCHGGGGDSFTAADPAQARRAVAAHRAHGTTTTLASLVSAPPPELATQVRVLADLVDEGLLAGVHLEGPFLAARRCGAHDPALLRAPDAGTAQDLLDAGRGTIRMVTLAPELPGALEAVRLLTGSGVLAALGHTDAAHDDVRAAVDAGASVATHLFNGMPPLHHREPGPVGALLSDERVTAELICDLVHLHPSVVRLAADAAGPERIVLVTDAISAAAAPDGQYLLGDRPVTARDGQARLADGSLAGSTLTMDAAVRNLVRECGATITDAVAAASANPARLLGLDDRIGRIAPGMSADLVVLDRELEVVGVLVGGEPVPGAGAAQ
ncbi:N-acetylglucosamine-6-phosphate deacetylase [Saccharopolyspora montiporae]|uniref:N-acetylglucosamine-6-phosphate deacetylase n=1 Tax=Saccharopolyspora montiporae TaxID=2781240 RepID=UPI00351C07BC